MKIETLKVFIGHSFILSYTTTLLLSFLLSTLHWLLSFVSHLNYASIVSLGSLGVAEKYIITSLFFPFTYVTLSARGDERKKWYT